MSYWIEQGACTGCCICAETCVVGAIACDGTSASIDTSICNGCGACMAYCAAGAVLSDEEGEPPFMGFDGIMD